MKAIDLKVTNLNISEDEYSYKGLFTLCGDSHSINVDLAELDSCAVLNEIAGTFSLSEAHDDLRNIIMDKVMVQASISSRIKEGIDFQTEKRKKKIDKTLNSLDMA